MAAMSSTWLIFGALLLLGIFDSFVKCQDNINKEIKGHWPDPTPERKGKVFSLFSIVTFQNLACQSNDGTTATSGRNRNGTCYTTTECADRGGAARGNCAAGFGVCCLFTVSAGGSTVTENCTYIQNPGFPSTYSATTAISYTINKCNTDICDVRLDFESFQTLGPTVTTELNGGTCGDSFVLSSTSSGLTSPVICGANGGQHLYMDMSTSNTGSAMLAFTFSSTASTTRKWEIKVTQIPCSSNYRAPSGCLQYITGLSGSFRTFNFDETTTPQHLASQDYQVCVRMESGYCCVEYQPCSDPNSYAIDAKGAIDNAANTDSTCDTDWLAIAGVTNECNQQGAILHTRICGEIFSAVQAATIAQSSICDCTAPFVVGIRTDATNDGDDAVNHRGVCLQYRMVQCQTN